MIVLSDENYPRLYLFTEFALVIVSESPTIVPSSSIKSCGKQKEEERKSNRENTWGKGRRSDQCCLSLCIFQPCQSFSVFIRGTSYLPAEEGELYSV